MGEMINLAFEGAAVRIFDRDGHPWFVLADVCRVLEIANVSDASRRVDDDEKDGVDITDPIGRLQKTTIVNESGLYSLILTSRKPEAKRFKKWVTSEVLPQIRKTGAYGHRDPVAMLNDPAALRGLLGSYAERVENLEFQIGEMAPKVQSFDRLVTAHGSVCITDAAKQLQVPPSELFRWLRTHNWLFKRGGADVPYQSRIALGYLEAKTTTVQRSDGTDRIVVQARITAKGLARLAGEFEGAPRLL